MNKLFTKVAALTLGVAMAAGVGVALGSAKASEVKAEDTTITLDFSSDSYGISTTQGDQTLTGDGATYGFEFNKNSGTGAKYNNDGYVLFGKTGVSFRNTSAPENSYISAISWTYTGGVSTNVQLGISFGSSPLTAASSEDTSFGKATQNGSVSLTPTDTDNAYFYIRVTNNYNSQFKTFSVTWSSNGGTPTTTYTVTDSVEHGSVSPTSVKEGATLSATITPDTGYELPESVSVTMGGSQTEFSYSDGLVTIDSVTGDVVISGTCPEKQATVLPNGDYVATLAYANPLPSSIRDNAQ